MVHYLDTQMLLKKIRNIAFKICNYYVNLKGKTTPPFWEGGNLWKQRETLNPSKHIKNLLYPYTIHIIMIKKHQ